MGLQMLPGSGTEVVQVTGVNGLQSHGTAVNAIIGDWILNTMLLNEPLSGGSWVPYPTHNVEH